MKVLVLLFLTIPAISLGQELRIDFEENGLTGWYALEKERWCVSGEHAIEGLYSLEHCFNSEQEDVDWISYIHNPLQLDRPLCTWQFYLRYANTPSGANNWAVIITENDFPDQTGTIQEGLILGVNFTGNSDLISIWQVSQGKLKEICTTDFNWQEQVSPGQVTGIRLSGSLEEGFSLYVNCSGSMWANIGWFRYTALRTAGAFTLFYRYTASHDQGLSFDELQIEGTLLPDVNAPEVKAVSVQAPDCIAIEFSEPVMVQSADTICMESIGCGNLGYGPACRKSIELPHQMLPGKNYLLHLPVIEDCHGNRMPSQRRQFQVYYPAPYDVVFTEIMADPEPEVLLPQTEYLELFNASDQNLYIRGWDLTVNSRTTRLPEIDLPAGEYILLTSAGFASAYPDVQRRSGLVNFPALNNEGALLLLRDASGRLIHSVSYSDHWHVSTDKRSGGWSLEMINPYDPCMTTGNWRSSEDYRGGTPGMANSVLDTNQLLRAPEIWRSAITGQNTLMLYFSKPLDSLKAVSPLFYQVDRGIGHPEEVRAAWPQVNSVELTFGKPFRPDLLYEVRLTGDLCDCSGTGISPPVSMTFCFPGDPDSADILINEIQFSPQHEHIEFIELYNHSTKTIGLKEFRLSIGSREDSADVITHEYWPLAPGDYALIAPGYSGISDPGVFPRGNKIVFMKDMPALPDAGSKIFLFMDEERISDIAVYSPDCHHDILVDHRGVSLERAFASRPATDLTNWHSASSVTGYMTPAAPNSQAGGDGTTCFVQVAPAVIIPDGEGTDDILQISYRLDREDYMGQVAVYDMQGRRRRSLLRGGLLGVEGVIEFDGRGDDQQFLPSGFYVLYFNAYNTSGGRHEEKLSFVMAVQ